MKSVFIFQGVSEQFLFSCKLDHFSDVQIDCFDVCGMFECFCLLVSKLDRLSSLN